MSTSTTPLATTQAAPSKSSPFWHYAERPFAEALFDLPLQYENFRD